MSDTTDKSVPDVPDVPVPCDSDPPISYTCNTTDDSVCDYYVPYKTIDELKSFIKIYEIYSKLDAMAIPDDDEAYYIGFNIKDMVSMVKGIVDKSDTTFIDTDWYFGKRFNAKEMIREFIKLYNGPDGPKGPDANAKGPSGPKGPDANTKGPDGP